MFAYLVAVVAIFFTSNLFLLQINHLRESLIHFCSESEKQSDLRNVQTSLDGLLELVKATHMTTHSSEPVLVLDPLNDSLSEQTSNTSVDQQTDTSAEAAISESGSSLVTFFTTCSSRFSDVQAEMKEELIPIDIFLVACTIFTQLLDRMAGTLLSPLRTDVLSNAEKIRKARAKITPKPVYLQVRFICTNFLVHCVTS